MLKSLKSIRSTLLFKQQQYLRTPMRAFSSGTDQIERESMDYDVLIVGGGPAGKF